MSEIGGDDGASDGQNLSRHSRETQDLHEERQQACVERKTTEVDRREADKIPPEPALHPKDEAPVHHETRDDAHRIRQDQGAHVVDRVPE